MKRKIKFTSTSLHLDGPIVNWYNQLHNTKVAELEFHQHRPLGSKPSSKIIVSLTDGSKYLLQRRVKHAQSALVPHFVDTIENVSSLNTSTQPLIHVKFGDKPEKRPDLLFVISVCYSAQYHGQLVRIAQFFIDDEFFALTMMLNVVRTWPSWGVASETLHPTINPTPIEVLWEEIHRSIRSQEHTFWAHTIANETKNIARELIYRAARSNIAAMLPQGWEEANLSLAASIVARVESIITKRELNNSNIWDDAWSKHWDTMWQNFNPEIGEGHTPLQGIWPTEIISGAAEKLTIDGRAPGSIAGRTPERYVLSMNGAAWLHSVLIGHHPSFAQTTRQNPIEVRETPQVEDANLCGTFGSLLEATFGGFWAMLTGEPDHKCKPQPPPALSPQASTINQGICPCPPRDRLEPDKEHKHEIWASPQEMAVLMAWEVAWPEAVDRGKKHASEIQNSNPRNGDSSTRGAPAQSPATSSKLRTVVGRAFKTKNGDHNKVPSTSHQQATPPQNNSNRPYTSSPPTPGSPFHCRRSSAATQTLRGRLRGSSAAHREEVEQELQALAKERTYRENKEAARLHAKRELLSTADPVPIIKLARDLTEQELKIRAHKAWNSKIATSDGLLKALEALAEQEWQKIPKESGQPSSAEHPGKAAWIKKFKDTWETAWKECWAKAWQAVWNEAWDAAVARGTEFGVEGIFDQDTNLRRATYNKLRSSQAYLDIERSINQGSIFECLEQVRSMMKELYRLYESLEHSIPVFRDEAVKITGFENADSSKAKANIFCRGRRTHSGERRPVNLSYYELQEWVEKRYINEKFQDNENGKRLFKRRIAEVWGTALDVYVASSGGSTTLVKVQASAPQLPLPTETTT